ncbi:hypothetical protein [Limosilactobacillus reuteri]|uniref:hypothetical protein n=1 Tax=Limosilactobacillus reuteri TaxID=1598 RepID=UPI001C0C3DA0|nr:hypothetical protein [Limosilactobacillus reuteri]QWS05049.1 hypothetical protein I6U32_04785 [Limosilactobacillus reuteri]
MDKKPEKLVPEVRFKGFTDDWEQRKFDNVVKRINDKDDNPELPHIEFENIISGNGTLNKNIKDVKGGFKLSFYSGLKMYDLGGLRIDRCQAI